MAGGAKRLVSTLYGGNNYGYNPAFNMTSNGPVYSTAKRTKLYSGGSGSLLMNEGKRRRNFRRYTYSSKARKFYKKGKTRELKYWDGANSNTSAFSGLNTNSGSYGWLLNGPTAITANANGIKVGSGVNERIGKHYIIKSILIRMTIEQPLTSGTNRCFRIIIAHLKTNGTDLASGLGNFLERASNGGSEFILSPLKLGSTPNFTVLKDTILEIDHGHGERQQWQFFHKCNLPVEMTTTSTTGGPTDFVQGQLYMFVCDDSGGLDTLNCRYTFISRIKYLDI